jgi:hypothetical protein
MTIKELKNHLGQLHSNAVVLELTNFKPHPQLENAVIFTPGIVKIPKEKLLDIELKSFEDDDESLIFMKYNEKFELLTSKVL